MFALLVHPLVAWRKIYLEITWCHYLQWNPVLLLLLLQILLYTYPLLIMERRYMPIHLTLLNIKVWLLFRVEYHLPRILKKILWKIEDPSSVGKHFTLDQDPNFMKSKNATTPGATTQKGSCNVERQSSKVSYYADDENGTHRKYS